MSLYKPPFTARERALATMFKALIARAASAFASSKPIRLVVDDETALQGRDPDGRGHACAAVEEDGSAAVYVADKLTRASRERQLGVLMHELAHVHLLQQGDVNHSERDADKACEALWGQTIYYDADDVQTVDPSGVHPRPARLDAKKNPGTPTEVASRRKQRGARYASSGMVTVFRACPSTETHIHPMDYVTLKEKFAREHADTCAAYHEEPQHVLRVAVPAKHVYAALNPGEYFYDGTPVVGVVVYVSSGEDA